MYERAWIGRVEALRVPNAVEHRRSVFGTSTVSPYSMRLMT
jgi:hypothetical protein